MVEHAELVQRPSAAKPRRRHHDLEAAPLEHLERREIDRAEQLLLGIQYAGHVPEPHPLIVRNAGHWLWEATGAQEGEEIEGLVAGEADRYYPRTPLPEHEERVLLAHSPYTDRHGVRRHQETSLYRAPSGAWVFASGTFAVPAVFTQMFSGSGYPMA